jgi:hypothetical protein
MTRADPRRQGPARRRSASVIASVALLGGGAVALLAVPASAAPMTLYVAGGTPGADTSCADPGFNTIQAAVDEAPSGATIEVCAGTYPGTVTVSTPDLTIDGAQAGVDARTRTAGGSSESVVSADGSDNGGFAIEASGVTIDGFTITGSSDSDGSASKGDGVLVGNGAATGTTVVNNIIEDNGAGLGFGTVTADVVVQHNVFQNDQSPSDSGEVFDVFNISNLLIDSNSISTPAADTNSSTDINLSVGAGNPDTGVVITNNQLSGATGVLLVDTDDAVVASNIVSDTGPAESDNDGIDAFGSDAGLVLTGNVVNVAQDSEGGADLGLYDQTFQPSDGPNGVTAYGNAFLNPGEGPGVSVASGAGSVTATGNWWGCTTGPNTSVCSTATGDVTSGPFDLASVTSSASGSTFAGTTTAMATDTTGSTTTTATGSGGTGTVTTSAYSADPVAAPTFSSTGQYFDVSTPGSTFATVALDACGVGSGNLLEWFDASTGAWAPVTGDPGPSSGSSCVTDTLDATTSPTPAELAGTVFGIGITPPKSPTPPAPPTPPASSTPGGYDLVGSDGGVFVFNGGSSTGGFYGSIPGLGIAVHNIVGISTTADERGYFLVGSDGGVFAFGDAPFENSLPGIGVKVNDIAGIVPTQDDQGYMLVGRDGGVFTLGNAHYEGSLPGLGIHVDDIVGIAATPSGNGYWLVSSTGAVYAFGDAGYYGNAAGSIVSITATLDGGGYWLTGADGSVTALGDATSYGSLPEQGVMVSNIVSLIPSPDSHGYLLVGRDGGLFAFGDATFPGSLPGLGVRVDDVVGGVATH